MRLFTITGATAASIMSLFVAIAVYKYFFPPEDGQARGYWCPKIVAEETAQRNDFHDHHAVLVAECKPWEWQAEADAKGNGTVAGTLEKVVSFVLPKSWASTRQ